MNEISVLYALNVLLRYRRAVVGIPVAATFLVVVVTLLLPPSYTATASFTPQSNDPQQSRLANLATEFGISVPTGGAAQSPQFYADLVRSREMLRKAVLTDYSEAVGEGEDVHDGARRDLVDVFGIEAESRATAVGRAIGALREDVRVSTDQETGVVELAVTTGSPRLSEQIAQRMIDLVHDFNVETRTSQASAERGFIEGQLTKAEEALRAAEDSLETFLENNRQYQSSPNLRFEHQRLQRRVTLRQQLYTSLSQSYQQARIDEVRNTPVITIVNPARKPATPDKRRLLFKGILTLVLGGTLAILWAFGRDMFAANRRQAPDDSAEFERLKRETIDEIGALWRRLRRAFR